MTTPFPAEFKEFADVDELGWYQRRGVSIWTVLKRWPHISIDPRISDEMAQTTVRRVTLIVAYRRDPNDRAAYLLDCQMHLHLPGILRPHGPSNLSHDAEWYIELTPVSRGNGSDKQTFYVRTCEDFTRMYGFEKTFVSTFPTKANNIAEYPTVEDIVEQLSTNELAEWPGTPWHWLDEAASVLTEAGWLSRDGPVQHLHDTGAHLAELLGLPQDDE